jgi:hypothetical protein
MRPKVVFSGFEFQNQWATLFGEDAGTWSIESNPVPKRKPSLHPSLSLKILWPETGALPFPLGSQLHQFSTD